MYREILEFTFGTAAVVLNETRGLRCRREDIWLEDEGLLVPEIIW